MAVAMKEEDGDKESARKLRGKDSMEMIGPTIASLILNPQADFKSYVMENNAVAKCV